MFLDSAVIQQVIPKQVHFVVDAIDSVSSKVSLAAYCVSHSIGIISCMGAGNRLDPLRFKIADVSETKVYRWREHIGKNSASWGSILVSQ